MTPMMALNLPSGVPPAGVFAATRAARQADPRHPEMI
jgi:hypothetical protein